MNFPIVVLISGRGSNMLRLLGCQGPYQVAAVVSNNPAALGVEAAAKAGVPTVVVPRSAFGSVAEQKRQIFERVKRLNPALVVLAGYMQILEPYFVAEFEGRIINIHPSLLPQFPGLDTHARALAAGCTQHGCTVHLVDAGVDTGSCIAQAVVQVEPGDSAQSLAERVQTAEHQLYPWVVAQIAAGNIILMGDAVRYTPQALADAHSRNFRLLGS